MNGFRAMAQGAAALLLAAFAGTPADAAVAESAVGCVAVETATGEAVFRVEIARTPAQQAQGLMWRDQLQPDFGMLFLYDTPRPVSFWMKNTFLPLDILFVRPDGRIHRIARDTEPLSLDGIPSGAPVVAVLEIVGGTSDRLGIRPGSRVYHPEIRGSGADAPDLAAGCRR